MNQISGKMLRFDWTWASERHGEPKLVWSPKPVVLVGRGPGFRVCVWAPTRVGKILLIRERVKVLVGEDETRGLFYSRSSS